MPPDEPEHIAASATNSSSCRILTLLTVASDARTDGIGCMRTTIDIDPVVFEQLKRRQAVERKTLGALVSELLAAALAERDERTPAAISWPSAALGALVDIDDRDALRALLDPS